MMLAFHALSYYSLVSLNPPKKNLVVVSFHFAKKIQCIQTNHCTLRRSPSPHKAPPPHREAPLSFRSLIGLHLSSILVWISNKNSHMLSKRHFVVNLKQMLNIVSRQSHERGCQFTTDNKKRSEWLCNEQVNE